MMSTEVSQADGAATEIDAKTVDEELEEIRAEAKQWQIDWEDKDPRTTTIAWFVYCARRDDETVSVTPLDG
jgi:hypothetical protein